MYKNIKNIFTIIKRTIGYAFEFLFLIIVLCSFAIQSAQFQKKIAEKATDILSKELNAKISIDKIRINGLHYIKIEGLYLEDQEKDTLLYAPSFVGNLDKFSLENKLLLVDILKLEDTRIKLQKYKGDTTLNIQFLLNYLNKKEKKKTSFKFLSENISLNNVHFSYDDWNVKEKDYGVDFKHIDIKKLHGGINKFQNHGASTRFSLSHLSLEEKSGFIANNLTAFVLVSPKKIEIKDLNILTPESDLNAKELTFIYRDFRDFRDYVNAVYMKGDVQASKLNMTDLSYFAPALKKMSHTVTFEGKVKGPVNELYVNDFHFGLSENTYINCDAEIKGLPYLDEVLFYIDISEAQTYREDLNLIDFKALGMKNDLTIPKQLKHLGVVNITGILDGFYNDFNANLSIKSDIGAVKADLICGVNKNSKFYYKGKLNTKLLEIDKISGVNDLGLVSSNLTIDGKGFTKKDISLKINGDIPLFEYKGYQYKNVSLDGKIEKASYTGKLKVRDNNIDLVFDGDIDMNQNPISFNFEADLQTVHLSDLNLIEGRKSAMVCMNIEANGFGNNLDDFSGFIHLNDVAYYENEKDYYFDSILFESQSNSRYHSINVFAQFAELSMVGNYSLDSLPQSLYGLGAKVLPSIFSKQEQIEIKNQQFDLDLKVNNLSMLTTLFYPELEVSDQTKINCKYQSNQDLLKLYFYSDFVNYKNFEFKGIELDTTKKISGFDPFYVFDLKIDTIIPKENLLVQNVELQTKVYQDNVSSSIFWEAPDSSYWGNIAIDGYILSPSSFEVSVLPSTFYGKKIGKWNIYRNAEISIDSTSIAIQNLLANNNFQTVRLNGKISEKPIDQLNFELGSFELSNINDLIGNKSEKTKLGGVVNLSGFVSDIYNDVYFDAYSWINNFSVSDEIIGDVELSSNWNAELERIELDGSIERANGIRDFEISKGYYYPRKELDNIDLAIDFKKTNLSFVNLFLPKAIRDLKGNLLGELTVLGELKSPRLQGDLYLDSAQVTIDMLNTTYYTHGKIKIEEDLIGLEALPIKDKFGSEATLVGSFVHQNFRNYSYDFFAFFDHPFLVMNTNYEQNPLYYGDAFATGDVSIGFEKILEINVNAKSEKGTNITLPLYGSEEVVLEDFITFVNKDSTADDYEVNLDGINLNLSLDITEDAEIQLVFDEVVGDAIKGIGSGHIDMYIDPFYDFYMFGNYTIKEGSYLFTLRDFINKKFSVKQGGTLSWYGNPYDADINLTAIYPLKASLYNIMPESERDLYKQKVNVNCEMNLTNSLFNPNIDFNINLPRSDENARSALLNLVNTPTEMNRQVFSLLILNKFLPRVDASGAGNGIVGATTSEMLSNQLSNMLSNFSDDFDIGFNYRPGDEISNKEVALALSTQLLNDKLTISTNLGVSSGVNGSNSTTSTSNFIGDVDVEYQLNDKGNLRVHAFNRSNEFDPTTTSNAKNTQGVGLFYQEDFNTFKELYCKLLNVLKKKTKRANCDEE